MELFAKGQDGQLELSGDMLIIHRKGVLAKVTKGLTTGERRIPIASITAVQFKPAGLTSGYIRFSMLGAVDKRPGIMAGTQDENQVQFMKKHQGEFEAIRDHIEGTIGRRESTDVGSGGLPGPALDPMDQVRKLAELRNQGIVSEEEFQAKKKALLGL